MTPTSQSSAAAPLQDALEERQLLDAVRQRQWRELISRLPTVFGAMLILSATFVYIEGSAIDSLALGLWLAALTAITLAIARHYGCHREFRNWAVGWPALIKQYTGLLVIQAALWGIGLAWLTPDDAKLLLISLMLLLAILSGTPLSVSSHFPTLAAYALLTILPMGVRFMLSSDPQFQFLGWVSLPCLVVFIQAGWMLNRHLLDAYRAMARNEFLVAALEQEKQVITVALGQAEAANTSKSRFLAGASHDLRQPLQAIGLMVSALGREDAPEKRDLLVGNLTKSVGRLDRLFNRLLDIYRLDVGKVQSNPVLTTSSNILQSLLRQFEGIAAKLAIPMRFRDAAHARFETDPDLLEQLLGNLVSNALRYAPRGQVLVAARRRGKRLVFQVWDTGVGIEPVRHKDIFEEFVQLDNPKHAQTRGLGLGLAIARRTALLLKAQLSVRSQPGLGSVFEVELECEAAQSRDTPKAPETPYLQGATNTLPMKQKPHGVLTHRPLAGVYILVVDDEPDILMGFLYGLDRSGCYVKTASGLRETRQWLDATERLPDALVVDYRLAHGDTAWPVIELVEQACGGPIAVVILTGEINPELIAKAAHLGYPVLNKPVSIVTLEANLQVALTRLETATASPVQTGNFSPLLASSRIA